MTLIFLRYLAMVLGPAITSTARPALTFAAMQWFISYLVANDLAALPATFTVFVSEPALAVGLTLAVVETLVLHDSLLASVVNDLHLDQVFGAMGALSAALLFAAMGLPEAEAAAMVKDAVSTTTAAPPSLLSASTEAATASDFSDPLQYGIVGVALGLNLILVYLRSQFLEFLHDFEVDAIWARIETGGIVAVLIILPLLPLLALALVIMVALSMAVLTLAARAAGRAIDQRMRIACDHCDYQVRLEASRCPNCRTKRTPTAEHSAGPINAWRALRQRHD